MFGRRWPRKAPEHLEELVLRDRAAAQLEVDSHVLRDRRRGLERADVLGRRVDRGGELAHVLEVAQRLDAAGRRARPDRHEEARLLAHLLDALGVVRRGDRALDEGEVVGALLHLARGLEEVRDLDLADDGEELVLAVEERELAAVAGGELEDGETRPRHLTPPACRRTAGSGRSGRRGRPCTRRTGRTGSGRTRPTAHFMFRSIETKTLESGTPRCCSPRAA